MFERSLEKMFERLEEILSRDEGKRKAAFRNSQQLTATKYMHVTEMGRGVF